MAPLSAWQAVGLALVMDTLILGFMKIPREARSGRLSWLKTLQTACCLTGDFLPFAAVFFLWSASVVMILAASLVPCLALLVHEAVRDLRQRRQRHGSLQMAVLMLCLCARLLAAHGCTSPWFDQAAAVVWMMTEVAVFVDLSRLHQGLSCARDATSQVLWTLATVGQVILVACSHVQVADSAASHSGGCGRSLRGGISLPGLGPRRQGPDASPGMAMLSRIGNSLSTGHCGVATGALQDIALVLMLACYFSIHAPVFRGWLTKAKQAVSFRNIEPGMVVFFDHPCHRLQ